MKFHSGQIFLRDKLSKYGKLSFLILSSPCYLANAIILLIHNFTFTLVDDELVANILHKISSSSCCCDGLSIKMLNLIHLQVHYAYY